METMPAWFWSLAAVLGALLLAAGLSIHLGRVDRSGGIAGVGIGMGLYLGGGIAMLILLLAFFLAGNLATSWRSDRKAALGLVQGEGKPRSAANALANGGVGALLGIWAWLDPAAPWPLPAMMAATLAAATSDTLSSELGNVYGRRYVNILTITPARRGADGVVSLEGTLFGIGGSLLIALLYGVLLDSRPGMIATIALAGMTGNLADSLLGATWQQRGWLNNHQVNVGNTLVGAATVALIGLMTGQ